MLTIDQFGSGPSLSLIHGWGAQNAVWKNWAQSQLAPHFCVTLIELPGFGSSPKLHTPTKDDLLADAWTQAILECLPNKTHLLGWSLGGLLAQNILLKHPEKVQSLICLASTPRFTQIEQWSGAVSPKLMADFFHSIHADSLATLKHFWRLQMQGSEWSRQSLRQFLQRMQAYQLPSLSGLTQGLTLLNHFDFRDAWQSNQTPLLWLCGEKDPLIPAESIAQFSKITPNARCEVIPGAAHSPFVSHPNETAQAIIQFIRPSTTHRDF